MKNIDKIKGFTTPELALFLQNMRTFSIYNYIDFEKWLESDTQNFEPNGTQAVYVSDKICIPCYIVEEKDDSKYLIIYKDPDKLPGNARISPEEAYKIDTVFKESVFTMDFIENLNRIRLFATQNNTQNTVNNSTDSNVATNEE